MPCLDEWSHARAPDHSLDRLENMVRILMIASGVLSLGGLIGVPFGDVQVLSIEILGYGVAAPVVFLLLGMVFSRTRPVPADSERNRSA